MIAHAPGQETSRDRAAALSLMTAAPAERIKAAAEHLLPLLGAVEVLVNRTGLVMLPYRDTARGTSFFLGEVLMAEAHIRCPDHDVEGYAMVVGRDLEQAMAVAVLDAIGAAGLAAAQFNVLLRALEAEQAAADEALRRDIEATRVQMETF
ncbi:MAG TPA: phosphonate C-P lyase system protein PhnG [Devosia sp.]|nr:phosphonate C-P lyase system protein PhnG [Devosia sp.]